jgi:hypothetical protein
MGQKAPYSLSTFEHRSAYPRHMPLPETISVRYTDEEAGYLTVRPVVRQTFQLGELLDMVLSVAGKDVTRVRQLLHCGTVVYHFYRYSWTGFDADDAELSAALARFPDADPARPFARDQCALALLESGGANPRHILELHRAAGSKRRMFRGKSFWERLVEIAVNEKLCYHGYSYGRHADLYRLDLNSENVFQIAQGAERLAPGNLRGALSALHGAASILFVCPRSENIPPNQLPLSKD